MVISSLFGGCGYVEKTNLVDLCSSVFNSLQVLALILCPFPFFCFISMFEVGFRGRVDGTHGVLR